MDGISASAPLKLANNYKYNSKELNHEEFSDETGLDWYDYGFRNYDAQIGRFIEQDPLTDGLATVNPYQYALNDPISNIDKDGLMPTSLLCPGSSGFAVFMAKAGAAISNIARIASPAEKAVSISAHALQVAGTVGNVIAFNDEINNFFTDRGVGMTAGPGPEDPDPPGWLKKIFQFFGWGSQSNDPETRWEYAKRNAELNNLTHQMDQAQEKLDKYSSYIPVVGGVVKMSEGMQYDKPMEVVGGIGSVGLDLFGGELFRGVTKGITVLGKFPDYINLASKLGARRFNIPIEIWNKMSPADQWAANLKFLDRAITRGDKFILANPVKDVTKVTGYFRRELDYLISKGYKLNDEGTQLIK